jgi:hypothetical protein
VLLREMVRAGSPEGRDQIRRYPSSYVDAIWRPSLDQTTACGEAVEVSSGYRSERVFRSQIRSVRSHAPVASADPSGLTASVKSSLLWRNSLFGSTLLCRCPAEFHATAFQRSGAQIVVPSGLVANLPGINESLGISVRNRASPVIMSTPDTAFGVGHVRRSAPLFKN